MVGLWSFNQSGVIELSIMRDTHCGWMCFKTHHYIICFVQPLHSEPGIESYCSSSTDQLSWWAYGPRWSQMVPEGVTRLFIMRDTHIVVGCVLSQ